MAVGRGLAAVWLFVALSLAVAVDIGDASAAGRLNLVQADVDEPGDDEGTDNPFAGRDIQSARAALDILLDEMGLGGIVAYTSIEEPGPQAVTLHDVVLADPDDPAMRLEIGRIVISDLDLEGLGTEEGPKQFAIALEAIDYASLAEGLRAFALLPLPVLDGRPTMTLAFSLLPAAAGEGRMTATFLGQLDRQLGLGFEVTASPVPGAATVDPFAADEAPVDAFVLEIGRAHV